MNIPVLHTILSEADAIPVIHMASSEQNRFHLAVALASLEQENPLFEGLNPQQLKEKRGWDLLTRFSLKWKEENGTLPTLATWARIERLSTQLFGKEQEDRLDCIAKGSLEDPSQFLANHLGQQRVEEYGSIQNTYSEDKTAIELCMKAIRLLLEIRSGYLSMEGLQTELVTPRIGVQDRKMMSAVALGLYSNSVSEAHRNRIPNCSLSRESKCTLSMTAALLVGEALLAQYKADPNLLPTTLDQLFQKKLDLRSFFSTELPLLPLDRREKILERLDSGLSALFYEYLPRILPMMFISLGSMEERNALLEKFFAWVEQNREACPLATYWLAHALTTSRTGLTEKWLPKCFTLFDEGRAPCPLPEGEWEKFALAQSDFAKYQNPFPWLQRGKPSLNAPLLTLLLRSDYPEERIQSLLEWTKTHNQPLLSYRVLDEVLQNTDISLSRDLAENLFSLVDPLSLNTSLFQTRTRNIRLPASLNFPDSTDEDIALYCLLVEKMATHPRILEDEYINARWTINRVAPPVNAAIESLKNSGDEKTRKLLPEEPIQPLPTPSGLRRFPSWLRYTVWPTAKLAAKVFARVITYFPRLAWKNLCKGGFKQRVITVGCAAAVTALFTWCFLPSTIVSLAYSAHLSWKRVRAIQEWEIDLEDVAKVTYRGGNTLTPR